MATPATAARIGTPASIRASDPPQTEAIDDEPFDSRMSLTHADGVGELALRRQQRLQRAAGQVAVADLAARRAAHELHFTDRERREVVVEHEALEGLAFEVLDLLRFLRRAEGDGDEGLRLAAGEDRGAVRAREHAEVDRDRADLLERAAVEALLLVEDEVAEDAASPSRRYAASMAAIFSASSAGTLATICALTARTASRRACLPWVSMALRSSPPNFAISSLKQLLGELRRVRRLRASACRRRRGAPLQLADLR